MRGSGIQTVMEHARLLAGVPAFVGIPREVLMGIVKLARINQFDSGKNVIEEGEVGTRLFVIVSGDAEVSCKSSSGQAVVASLRRGDLFGEIAVVVPKTPRTATVTATTSLTVISFSSEDFDRLCVDYPQVRTTLTMISRRILLLNFIKRSSPFSTLSPKKTALLLEHIKSISVAAGALIIKQGERGNYCYLLKSGLVDVVLKDGTSSRVISTLYPGALFGEASLLTNAVRNSSVVSREASELLAIGRQDLFDAVVADRVIAARMMELLQLRDRPCQKTGIIEQVMRQDERGTMVVLKDPEMGTYYRLTPEGKFLWEMLDGKHSLRDLTLAFFEEFKLFSPQAIAEVLGGLGKAGFLESTTWAVAVQRLLLRLPWFSRVTSVISNTLQSVMMVRHVDGWFSRWYNNGVRFLFTTSVQIVLGLIAVAGIILFACQTPQVLPQLSDYAFWQFGLWVVPPLLLSFVVHELGHGFAVKRFGREVLGVGVGWYWVTPIMFVDTSDMWLSERIPRVCVDLAGIYTNMILAGLAMLAMPHNVYAWVFTAVSYGMVVINLLPIKGTDGHYALTDFLASSSTPQMPRK